MSLLSLLSLPCHLSLTDPNRLVDPIVHCSPAVFLLPFDYLSWTAASSIDCLLPAMKTPPALLALLLLLSPSPALSPASAPGLLLVGLPAVGAMPVTTNLGVAPASAPRPPPGAGSNWCYPCAEGTAEACVRSCAYGPRWGAATSECEQTRGGGMGVRCCCSYVPPAWWP